MPAPDSTDHDAALERLRTAPLRVLGRMPWSSNATLLVLLDTPDAADLPFDPEAEEPLEIDLSDTSLAPHLAIYKPEAGERPLWDFPPGLHRREAACHELALALGWDLIPPTVVRDGPHGEGSVQQFVAADPNEHYFTLLEDERFHDQLRRLAVFDLVANSTDRKGGHVLRDADDHLWAIDNGLSFHVEFKVRTVIWDFAGEDLPADLLDDLVAFRRNGVPEGLRDLLDPSECEAVSRRVDALVAGGRLPADPTGRRHPWPLV